MTDPLKTSSISSEAPGFFRSVYDGAVWGDLSGNQSGTKAVSQVGTGLIPFVGQVVDARDTYAAARDVHDGKPGSWGSLAFAVAGWVPLAGDFAKSVHKIGVKQTLSGVANSFKSIKRSWSELSLWNDAKKGVEGKWWYKPATDLNAKDLGDALGTTNRFGDIAVLGDLTNAKNASTLDHELVHRFLSPSFVPLQEFRANLGLLGYSESHLLRRVEEGLAESWSQFKQHGVAGLKEGWSFPYRHPYGLDKERVKIESHIVAGVGASAVAAGMELGKSIDSSEDKK